MPGKGFTVSGVKEISRGKDWVKFLVSFSGETANYAAVAQAHDEWADSTPIFEFGCGRADVMKFNFDDSKVIFKFETEPYSMKSNDCYRYIDAFGKWDGRRTGYRGPDVSATSETTSTKEKPVFDAKTVVDDIIEGLKGIRIAGIDQLVAGDAFASRSENESPIVFNHNPPPLVEKREFRTTNDVRVKSLISRLKAKSAV